MSTIYKSKIGKGPLIYVSAVVGTVTVIMLANRIWIMAIIMIFLIAFITHMYLTTWYKVNDQKLEIKCGLLYNFSIDIASIKKIVEMKNPISSPALSLDRLEIAYGKNSSVLISPINKMDFITHILRLNPNVIIRLKEHNK